MKMGFTRIQQPMLNLLITHRFTSRQYRVILIILRLTEGCRAYEAELNYSDFSAALLGKSHAASVINGLVAAGIIIKNRKFYRLNEAIFTQIEDDLPDSLQKLSKLIGKQLNKYRSKNSNSKVTKGGTVQPQKGIKTGSYNGNSGSHDDEAGIDINTYNINRHDKDKSNGIPNKDKRKYVVYDPMDDNCSSQEEVTAKSTWRILEDNIDSFAFHIYAARNIRNDLLIAKAQEIAAKKKLRNKGAVYVKWVTDFLRKS